MDIAAIQPYLTFVKDILTALATIATIYVAITGLQTWKRQLRGNSKYELARRVLMKVYKVRDAIGDRRLVDVFGGQNLVEKRKMHEAQIAQIDEANANLRVELLEADIFWGHEKDYEKSFTNLFEIAFRVRMAFWRYYDYDTISTTLPLGTKENAYSELFMFTSSVEGKESIDIALERAIKRIEDFLRPKLMLR